MRVRVPAAHIDEEVEQRLRKVGKTAKLKGFRPGKIPAKVLRRHYGAAVREEVLQDMLRSSYTEALGQENLRPVVAPKIESESAAEGRDLDYTATFEVYPEIEVAGLDGLRVAEPVAGVSEADIDEMLEKLREQRADWIAVERPAADGDRVTVDFEGSLKGEPIEGGKGEDVPVVLGSGEMLPEFEENLAGLRAGDEKTFKLKFPKDYHAEALAGKKASFSATVKEVAERRLPDVGEEFIRGLGIDSGELAELQKDLRRNMEREAESKSRSEVRRQVIEQILEANPIEVRAALVEDEARVLQKDAMRRMGIEDPEEAPETGAFSEAAEQRVRLQLLMAEVIRESSVELDRERVKAKVDELCAPYDNPEELRRMYFKNPELLRSVESAVIEDQVIEWLVSRAEVTKKESGFSELMADR